MGPECKCGCGEHLPFGSTRDFKRGHKARMELLGSPAPKPQNAGELWQTVSETDESLLSQSDLDALHGGYAPGEIPDNLAFVMAGTPDDAPPADEPPRGKSPAPKIKITRKVQQDVEGKLIFWLSMPSAMLMPLDPICMGAIQENIPAIAHAAMPLVCQSPEVVAWLTKTGNFALWADLAMACWPVIQIMIAHHIMKSIGEDKSKMNGRVPQHDYPAFYPAAS